MINKRQNDGQEVILKKVAVYKVAGNLILLYIRLSQEALWGGRSDPSLVE